MIPILTGQFIQNYTSLSTHFQAVDSFGRILAMADMPNNQPFQLIEYHGLNNALYYLRHDLAKDFISLFTHDAGHEPMIIFNAANKPIGCICRRRERTGLKSLQYFEIQLFGRRHRIYSIGMGKDGIKYPIFDCTSGEEQQVALMEKPAVVYDMKDVYDYWAKDYANLDILFMYALYVDYMNFANRGVFHVMKSTETTYMYSFNKTEKQKYNPAFKTSG